MSEPISQPTPTALPTPPIDATQAFRLHVDGGLYRFLGTAKNAEDGSLDAVYEHLHPFERGAWTRPLAEFDRRFSSISFERASEILDMERGSLRVQIAQHKADRRASESQAAQAAASAPRAKLYCLGFMFSLDRKRVALIRKKTPEWQAGMLNAVGGKAEPGESSLDAMAREFEEETGVSAPAASWQIVGLIGAPEFEVHVYRCFSDQVDLCRTTTHEEVFVAPFDPAELLAHGVSGLAAMACCALDPDDLFTRFEYRQWADLARAACASASAPKA